MTAKIFVSFAIFAAIHSCLMAAEPKKVAAIVTEYRHNSHADVIVSRLLQTYTLDGKGATSPLRLASLYTDQVPPNDTSRKLAAEYKFPIYNTVADALTLGTGKLAVDGVLLIAEHGKYAASDTGNIQYPKRRLFEQIVTVFESSGRVAPVFIDKHVADNWADAKWIYDTAQRLRIPLMAGSSLPVLWRYPEVDVPRDAEIEEFVAVSYHTLDAYGFHALEMLECLAERRHGGESGIRAVQCLTGKAVWEAGEKGVFDAELLRTALGRLKRPPPTGRKLSELVAEPVLFVIEYADGLRANVLTLNGAVGEWAIAWRGKKDRRIDSTLFWTQEARPFMHFTYLLNGVEQMMLTGKSAWPVERTLLTSGALDALLISKKQGGKRIETPYLQLRYQTDWNWQQPPAPPPGRPIGAQ
jgi:hypothetical protein